MSNGLIESVLGSWLSSVKERSQFEVSFRSLLLTLGLETVGRKTTHGPMEQGKDVAAWSRGDRVLHLFQLKAGDIRPDDWSAMHTELQQLVLVPYDHPNYRVGGPYKPVWVCTGEMSPNVRSALARQNEDYRRQGKPEVEVWEQGTLIQMFRDGLFTVQLLDVDLAAEHIRTWSHASEYTADEPALGAFFGMYAERLVRASGTARSTLLSSYLVSTAQLAQRYIDLNDPCSAVDCAVLGVANLLSFLARARPRTRAGEGVIEFSRLLLLSFLDPLVAVCAADPARMADLASPDGGAAEIFQLPLRVHSLSSKFALAAFIREQMGLDFAQEQRLLSTVVGHHECFSHLLSERQMGTFLVTLLALLRFENRDLGVRALVKATRWTAAQYGDARLPGLPSPYHGYREIPFHWLGVGHAAAGRAACAAGDHSYLLPLLVRLACLLNQRGVLQKAWYRISRTVMEASFPDDEGALYAGRTDAATMRSWQYRPTQSWAALRKEVSRPHPNALMRLAARFPEALLVTSLAYPWRAFWCEPSRYANL